MYCLVLLQDICLTPVLYLNTGNILNATTPYYPDSFYSLTRLIITLFIAIVGNAGMWAIVVIMPNLGDEFQVTRSVLSIPYTLTMLGFALGNVFLGRIVDRFGITRAIVLASVLNAFGYVCASIFDSFLALAFFPVSYTHLTLPTIRRV